MKSEDLSEDGSYVKIDIDERELKTTGIRVSDEYVLKKYGSMIKLYYKINRKLFWKRFRCIVIILTLLLYISHSGYWVLKLVNNGTDIVNSTGSIILKVITFLVTIFYCNSGSIGKAFWLCIIITVAFIDNSIMFPITFNYTNPFSSLLNNWLNLGLTKAKEEIGGAVEIANNAVITFSNSTMQNIIKNATGIPLIG